MRSNYTHSVKSLWIAALFCVFAFSNVVAQTQDVCQNGGCSSTVLSIPLDGPLQANPTAQRTEQFKAAYLQVKRIKNNQSQDPSWNSRYEGNELGGRNCVRLNQLESHFAYEYEQNSDFKQFIDQNEPDIQAFKEKAFESCRRALNLTARMGNTCPREISSLNNSGGPSTDDLPEVYQKLGQVLGYFDEKAKPAEKSSEPKKNVAVAKNKKPRRLSRRKQIAQLKERLNQLPVGLTAQDQLLGVSNDLEAARPDQVLLNNFLKDLEPRFTTLAPKPEDVENKLEVDKGRIDELKSFEPKVPNAELSDKIVGLSQKREDLTGRSQELGGQSSTLRDQYDQLINGANEVQNDMEERASAIETMRGALDNLEQRKEELMKILEEKPKKRMLGGIRQQVDELEKEAVDLSQKVEAANRRQQELSEDLDELAATGEEVADQLAELEQEAEDLDGEEQELEKSIEECEAKVQEIKAQEEKMKGLQERLEDLKSGEVLQDRIALCEEYLQSLLENAKGAAEAGSGYQENNAELSAVPTQVVDKLSDLKLYLNKLKLGENEIPVTSKTLGKIDELLDKVSIIASSTEILTNKQKRLQQRIEEFAQDRERVEQLYTSMVADLGNLQQEIVALSTERSDLQRKLEQAGSKVGQVESQVINFLDRYRSFEEKSRCTDKEQEIEALQAEQAYIEQELRKLEAEFTEVSQQEEKLEVEAVEVEQEIKEHIQLVEELKQEEEVLQKEFGEEVTLDAVTVEEWKEGVEVKRPYWEASLNPDDELVRGYKGKYFEISLKDAEKNAKVLFRPGRYSMDKNTFRTNYGATIGSFVTEALHYVKKDRQETVKLFIQGSADITGNDTFRGRQDPKYRFEEITLLPQDPDQEHFISEELTKEIPRTNFRNDDLPDLRARYLKEMIAAYTNKFDPIVLEGVVKDIVAEGERNAVIYLFFPDELLQAYVDK